MASCIAKPVSKGFEKLGLFVGTCPWVLLVLAIPVVLPGVLGGGFYFLGDREANEIEDQFTPANGQAKREREYVKTYFPHIDEFSQLRLYTEGTYASLIVLSSSGKDLLSKELFQKVIDLDNNVQNITTEVRGSTYADLCAKTKGKCASNVVLDIASKDGNTSIDYPFNRGEFLGSTIGGVTLKPNSKAIQSAEAIRLFYYLKDAKTEMDRSENDAWLHAFLKTFSEENLDEMISISHLTSISRQEEFDRNLETAMPFLAITYFLKCFVAVASCVRLNCVRNKVWVAFASIISAGLAVISSFGFLLYCGMPFSMAVVSALGVVLDIGVSNMLIMLSCWEKTPVDDDVDDRMAETYKEAAVSITITTLTGALAFYLGVVTPFHYVQSFCMYTGLAILFSYIFNFTFFGACLALNGEREESNSHWLICREVDCIAGEEKDMPFIKFFKRHFEAFITNIWTMVFVAFLYVGYMTGSIYGCCQIEEGMQLKNLAPYDSYVASYYDNEDRYFASYGPFVMLVIEDENFQYWEKSARENLNICLKEFESSDMVAKNMTISWLDAYEQYGARTALNISDKSVFMGNLDIFLNESGFYPDVNISSGKILASRLFIPSINISTTADKKNMLDFFRDTASTQNMDMLVYHPAFIFFDQYAVIVTSIILNIVAAPLVIHAFSFLCMPKPHCSLWVIFNTASVIVGVVGFMGLWDVNLDPISMSYLVICIVFSVEFSAHISYALLSLSSSSEKTSNEKATDIIYLLYPVIEGAVSAIVGVLVLPAANTYMFSTFGKAMFLVHLFGAVHSLVFIPVFLALIDTICDHC